MKVLPFTEIHLLKLPGFGKTHVATLMNFFAEHGLCCTTVEDFHREKHRREELEKAARLLHEAGYRISRDGI